MDYYIGGCHLTSSLYVTSIISLCSLEYTPKASFNNKLFHIVEVAVGNVVAQGLPNQSNNQESLPKSA